MVKKGCVRMMRFSWRARIFIFAFAVQTLPQPCPGAVKLDRLGRLLTSHGYGGAELVDSGKFYHLPIRSDDKPGHLVIDTGSSGTLIFRSSVSRLGLTETRTREYVRGVFGPTHERFGLAMIHSFIAGNCTIRNVPVAIASDLGASQSYGRPNGLLGLHELMKFGAVLDLSRRMLYLRPTRPDHEMADRIRSIMESAGWKAVTLTFVRNHLRVPGEANDVPCHFLVDTGAYRTVLDRSFAAKTNIPTQPTRVIAHGVGGASGSVQVANLRSLWIGDYQIKNARTSVLSMDNHMLGRGTPAEAAGLIGLEYLALNSAVFDFVSGTLYLKPRPRQ